jgi:hypothetical protein
MTMGFGKRRERTHALGKAMKRAFEEIRKVPILGDILDSTPLGSAVKVFGSALSGDLRGVAKSGLGLLPGAAGKIGGVVAEFIPEKSDEIPISENMQRIRDDIEMENQQKLEQTIEGQRLMREDPVFAKAAREQWKQLEKQQNAQIAIGGASDASKMFGGGGKRMVGGKLFA